LNPVATLCDDIQNLIGNRDHPVCSVTFAVQTGCFVKYASPPQPSLFPFLRRCTGSDTFDGTKQVRDIRIVIHFDLTGEQHAAKIAPSQGLLQGSDFLEAVQPVQVPFGTTVPPPQRFAITLLQLVHGPAAKKGNAQKPVGEQYAMAL